MGSEMCIRDRLDVLSRQVCNIEAKPMSLPPSVSVPIPTFGRFLSCVICAFSVLNEPVSADILAPEQAISAMIVNLCLSYDSK